MQLTFKKLTINDKWIDGKNQKFYAIYFKKITINDESYYSYDFLHDVEKLELNFSFSAL